MAVILASSCLLGCECRYKGDGCKCDALIKLAESNTIIGVLSLIHISEPTRH